MTLVDGSATSGATSALLGGPTRSRPSTAAIQLHASTGTLTQTVNPAALAITANNASKTYGQTASFAGTAFTASGLVNGDTVSSVTETSTGSGPTAAVGTDPIVPSAATFSAGLSSNYTITYANGTLTVNPARADDHGQRREQDLRPDGIVPRHRVHDQRPGQRRHGRQRDRDQHGVGGDGGGRD